MQQRLAEYHSRQADLKAENEEYENQRRIQQQQAKARREAIQLSQIHTCSKKEGYICQCCGKPIPYGEKYRRSNIPVGYGYLEGTHYIQRITHLVCVIEAKRGSI